MGLSLCREMGEVPSPLLARFMPFLICAFMRFLLGSFFSVRLKMSWMSPRVSPSLPLMVSPNSFSAGHSVNAGASGFSLQLAMLTFDPELTVPCKTMSFE